MSVDIKHNNDASSGLREFEMTYQDFVQIRDIAYRLTGITLSDHKQNMIYGRLARRLRILNINTFNDYCALLNNGSPEVDDFINAITTNLTAFFRENHHFEFLKKTALPAIIKKNNTSKKLRIWSAGCSTGEEPYSIAMTLSAQKLFARWNAKILATDLDTNVLEKGRQGIYLEDRCTGIPDEYSCYLKRNSNAGQIKVRDDIRELITFKQLNLLHDWPMKGPFDIIFCRNVVIYFDQETQKKLFARYAKMLTDGGYLFIGHSENLSRVSDAFTSLGRTIYQKK